MSVRYWENERYRKNERIRDWLGVPGTRQGETFGERWMVNSSDPQPVLKTWVRVEEEERWSGAKSLWLYKHTKPFMQFRDISHNAYYNFSNFYWCFEIPIVFTRFGSISFWLPFKTQFIPQTLDLLLQRYSNGCAPGFKALQTVHSTYHS